MRAVSLFSNCGAGDVGYSSAGFEFDVMAELKRLRLDVALENHAGAVGVHGDLGRTWRTVVRMYRERRPGARLGLLSACPPCQGVSSARGKRGLSDDADAGSEDERNLLVVPIANVAAELRPRAIVVENVPAFLRRKVRHPKTRKPISAARLLISRLEKEYFVFPLLADLCDYGVPQTRKRAFLTFIHHDEPCLLELLAEGRSPYPKPTHAPDHGGKPVSLQESLEEFALPGLDAGEEETACDPDRPLHRVPVWSAEQYAMVAMIPPDSGASAWQTTTCLACGPVEATSRSIHCPKCKEVLPRPVMKVNGKYRLVRGFRNSTYRRMPPHKPAQTITTASGRVGGNFTLHPWENRVFSPLECAHLQTFPDDFRWGEALDDGEMGPVRAMIGEAVPPMFTRQHGEVLSALLRGEDAGPLVETSDPRCVRAEAALLTSD